MSIWNTQFIQEYTLAHDWIAVVLFQVILFIFDIRYARLGYTFINQILHLCLML